MYTGADAVVGHILMRRTSDEVSTHKVHVVYLGDDNWERWLTFREYLRRNAKARPDYSRQKEALAERHPLDRNSYQEGKSQVIARLVAEARTTARKPPAPGRSSTLALAQPAGR